MAKIVPVSLILWILVSAPAIAQETNETSVGNGATVQDGSVPQDDKQTWNIGITKFLGRDVSEEYGYLTSSIPRIIAETISRCEEHRYTDEELKSYKKKLIEKEIRKLKTELNTLRENRDREFFNPEDKKDELERLDKRIALVREKLEHVSSVYWAEIEVAREKPVKFIRKDETSQLLDYPLVSEQVTAEKNKLDFLIYGFIEEVEGYLFIEVKGWNAKREEEVFDYTGGFSAEEVNTNAVIIGEKLRSVVLGHEWAEMTVKTEPETGEIYIDNRFYAEGTVRNVLLKPGSYEVEIRAEGYKKSEREVVLRAEEKKEIPFTLLPAVSEEIRIKSSPPDADVYINSMWEGKTPLSVGRPKDKREMILKKEDYRDELLILGPHSDGTLSITLSPDLFDWENYIVEKRNAFYLSLGIFALSLPVPIILYSVTEDLATSFEIAYQERNIQEMKKIQKSATVTYHSYIGGLFLATTLLVNTFIHLFDLISASAER